MPSPTPLNGFLVNHPSTRLRPWQGQLCSNSGCVSSATRLPTSPPPSTCRPASWGSPPAILCSGCVAALHVRWRKLPAKHVSSLGDTGWKPCQAIGLLGTGKVCAPCLSAGEQHMPTRGLWRVSLYPAIHSLPLEWLCLNTPDSRLWLTVFCSSLSISALVRMMCSSGLTAPPWPWSSLLSSSMGRDCCQHC